MITLNNRMYVATRFQCGGSGGDASAAMRKQEALRQAHIKGGLAQINSIFGGGSYGTNPISSFDPAGHYFNAEGTPYQFDPTSLDYLQFARANKSANHAVGGGGNNTGRTTYRGGVAIPPTNPVDPNAPTPPSLQAQYMKDLASRGMLFGGTASSPGFGQAFYDKRAQDYTNFAAPQVGEQYAKTQADLEYKLADQGILGGSAAGKLATSLQTEKARQLQGVADAGRQQAQDLRANVENKRGALVSQLEASADPAASSQLALSAATQFSAPSAFAPIGGLFNEWANQYLTRQTSNAYAPLIAGQYGGQQRQFGGGVNPAVGSSYTIQH